tara:strand:- start:100 stop:294 length:195 start_codon:yes stop_codon:yes gene_type:complete
VAVLALINLTVVAAQLLTGVLLIFNFALPLSALIRRDPKIAFTIDIEVESVLFVMKANNRRRGG